LRFAKITGVREARGSGVRTSGCASVRECPLALS
jgi:hypothetical protein